MQFHVRLNAVRGTDRDGQLRLKQAIAAAVAQLTGWKPVLRDANATLTATLATDSCLLLGLALPVEALKQTAQVPLRAPALGPLSDPALNSEPGVA